MHVFCLNVWRLIRIPLWIIPQLNFFLAWSWYLWEWPQISMELRRLICIDTCTQRIVAYLHEWFRFDSLNKINCIEQSNTNSSNGPGFIQGTWCDLEIQGDKHIFGTIAPQIFKARYFSRIIQCHLEALYFFKIRLTAIASYRYLFWKHIILTFLIIIQLSWWLDCYMIVVRRLATLSFLNSFRDLVWILLFVFVLVLTSHLVTRLVSPQDK